MQNKYIYLSHFLHIALLRTVRLCLLALTWPGLSSAAAVDCAVRHEETDQAGDSAIQGGRQGDPRHATPPDTAHDCKYTHFSLSTPDDRFRDDRTVKRS